MRRSCSLSSFVGLALLLCAAAPAALAQGVSEPRGPKFLLASASPAKAPVVVEAGSVALLRRRVGLSLDGVTVSEALAEIARVSGLQIVYADGVVAGEGRVHLKALEITVAAALTVALLDAGVDVVVTPGGSVVLMKSGVQETGSVSGRVTDAKTGQGVAGARVMLDGTGFGTATNDTGGFRITNVPPGTYTVTVRRIGYAQGVGSVTVAADEGAVVDVRLEVSASPLDAVVVTGTVVPTEVKALPNPISVITAEQLEQQNVRLVDDLFRGTVPGATSWALGPLDYSSIIRVRGVSSLSTSGTIKTYVDGVELANNFLVATIDPKSIERIEIVRGPQASTLYGAEALNGVMQVFTKKGSGSQRPTLSLTLSGGPFETKWRATTAVAQQEYALSVGGGTGDYGYNLGGTHGRTGEWLDQFFVHKSSLYGSLQGTQGPLSATLTGRYYTESRGFPLWPLTQPYPALRPDHDEQRLTDLSLGVTLGYRVRRRWQHQLTLGYNGFGQRIQYNPFTQNPRFRRYTNESSKPSIAYNTGLDIPLSPAVTANLTAGADHFAYGRTITQVSSQDPDNTVGVMLDEFAPANYTNTGYFLQSRIGIQDQLFFTAGIRADRNGTFGAEYGLAWAPRVGTSYVQPLGAGVTLKARASYGKGIRAPAPNQRLASVSSGAQTLANPKLGPETQVGGDAGLDLYLGERTSLGVTLYDQRAEDLIDYVVVDPSTTPPTRQFQNIGEIRNRGLELEARVGLLRSLTLAGTISAISSKVRTLSPSYTGAYRPGDPLLSTPTRLGGATVTYVVGRSSATVSMTYFGSWTGYNWADRYASLFGGEPYRGSERAYWRRYPGFAKLKLGLSHEFARSITGFLSVENLTNDTSVEYDDSIVTPGRVSVLGVRARW